jgi:predicted lipid-binding transport protein (Tim44 family)
MGRLGPLAAILACCGVKLVVLAALLIPAGFLTENTLIGLVALVVALLLIVVAVRRRRRCDGGCHLPGRRGDEERSEEMRSD